MAYFSCFSHGGSRGDYVFFKTTCFCSLSFTMCIIDDYLAKELKSLIEMSYLHVDRIHIFDFLQKYSHAFMSII